MIIGGSVAGEGHWRRALAIVGALSASVFLFTLVLKVSTAFINIPALFWQLLSGGLLVIFGLVTIFPKLWDKIPGVNAVYRKANLALGSGYQRQGVWGDIIVGAALGPVFSSCSPTYFVILAAVLPVSLVTGTLYLLAYVIGLGLFLLVIAVAGQKLVNWLGIASNPDGWFKKAIGILFLIVGIAVIFGWDKKLEAALPGSAFGEIGIEQSLLGGTQPASAPSVPSSATTTPAINAAASGNFLSLVQKAALFPKAPELTGIAGYINTGGQPISLAQYRGKNVVLVDFWDYSCINCQRTTPYLNAWYQKYKDQGLVVIGVHTPEFAFEQLQGNVQAAAEQFGIKYPVVLDNQYKTWQAFNNEYWPNEYLIDIDGYIVYNHSGEGDYDVSEHAIQAALAERAARLGVTSTLKGSNTVNIPATNLNAIESPETYFGSSRNQYLANGTAGVAGTQTLALPSTPPLLNSLYLGGTWNFLPEYAEASAGATVRFEYSAHDVYIVATNPSGPVKIKVLRDGQPVGNFAGADVNPSTSEAVISGDRLYKLVHDASAGVHTIQIQVEQGTLDAYTFTFG